LARYQVSFEKAAKEKKNLKLKEIQVTWPPFNKCPWHSAFSALSASGVLYTLNSSELRRLPDLPSLGVGDSPTRRVGKSFFNYKYLREFEAKIGTARNVV
jgi:hypothetical protein